MEAIIGKWVLIGIVALALGGGVWWVKHRVDLSYAQEQTIEVQQQVIEDQRKAAERKAVTDEANRLASRVANARIEQAQTEAAERISAFTRRGEGRFERLLQEKPGLVVPRANRGTDRMLKHAECVASARSSRTCGVPGTDAPDDDDAETGAVVDPAGFDWLSPYVLGAR